MKQAKEEEFQIGMFNVAVMGTKKHEPGENSTCSGCDMCEWVDYDIVVTCPKVGSVVMNFRSDNHDISQDLYILKRTLAAMNSFIVEDLQYLQGE